MSAWPSPLPVQADTRLLRASLWPPQPDSSSVAQDPDTSSLDKSHQTSATQAVPVSHQAAEPQQKECESLTPGERFTAATFANTPCRLSPSASSSQSKSSVVQTELPIHGPPERQDRELGRLRPVQLSTFPSQPSTTSVPTVAVVCNKQQPGVTRPGVFKQEFGDEDDAILPEDGCEASLVSSEPASTPEFPATVEELRVKNRGAQKRYRERQKVTSHSLACTSGTQYHIITFAYSHRPLLCPQAVLTPRPSTGAGS